ncbi:MAG: fructosamine kinase family protein [Verrucomicrobia bacterium]|nr:fructosamine kinase family protein [Verrucomicrobiota bacterium]
MWAAICKKLANKLGTQLSYKNNRSIGGGCINNTQALETTHGTYFVKLNSREYRSMFEAEAESLKAIKRSKTIRCPEVILVDEIEGFAVLILEFIPMQATQKDSMEKLGNQLANFHNQTDKQFGWHIDNFIGRTPQLNRKEHDWITFFTNHRLDFQFNLCEKKGLFFTRKKELLETIDSFFGDYRPMPSLLHGDLWGGNLGFDNNGEPVLYDPACYYGDREADLAFTEMFGGFSGSFYNAYHNSFPLHPGYSKRKRLYNLYHELNHYFLFGGGYGEQAQETIRYLLDGS